MSKNHVKPQKTTIMSGVLTVTGSRKANHRRSTHTPRVNSQTYSTHTTYHTPQATFHTTTKPHDTTPHQVTSRQSRPHQQQTNPFGQGHFQFKESAVDARASPVAASLIQWEKGCDKWRGLVLDVRAVVEVAGTSWSGTVHEQDVGTHLQPSEVLVSFSSDAVSLLLLLLLPVSLLSLQQLHGQCSSCRCRSCGCGSCHLPQLPHLLQFTLTLLPITLLLLLSLPPLPLPPLCVLLFMCRRALFAPLLRCCQCRFFFASMRSVGTVLQLYG